ncbi:hypothetical protein VP1G_05085 [Cytospora mali]|uniref:6-phosphogluconolactonase n=1 Tax=Cytospora mali TaxID=578113 RepID=A0A194V1L5_CYTMA|nr:hypothetical protein VP1G_05085 [Valsa mali var. pyri (nom. inval.)]
MKLSWTSSLRAVALMGATATATNLYVSSYSGTVTSLSLTVSNDGTYSLEQLAVNDGAAPSPSFLLLNGENNILYATDENVDGGNGSISAYTTLSDGSLARIDRQVTLPGTVHLAFYNDRKNLVLAHYSGSSVSSWAVQPNGTLSHLQSFTFTQPPRTNPRQDSPHPHGVFLDPTTDYILSPDLGADQIRIFHINKKTGELDIFPSLNVTSESGPRHATFLATAENTYLFIINELGNSISSYKVEYDAAGPQFTEVAWTGILGNNTIPSNVTAAEIVITPDQKHILTSSRGDNLFNLTDPLDASANLTSDSLQSWTIGQKDAALSLDQIFPAGGKIPRQFSINKNGTLAAVGLQGSARVAIITRDEVTNKFGEIVAEFDVPGEVTSIIWDADETEEVHYY